MLADTTTIPGVIIPEAFKEPSWVPETFKKFTDTFREDFKKNSSINSNLVRKLIKEVIFDDRLTIPFPLNKGNVGRTLEEAYQKFDTEEFQWRYYLFYRVGFFLSTFTGTSFTPESLELPAKFVPKKKEIIDEYHKRLEDAKDPNSKDKAIHWVDTALKKLATEVLEYFRDHRDIYPVVDLLDSGAKGSEDDLRKLLIAIGLSINAKNEVNNVIDRSGSEGLTPTQFFNYSSQSIVTQYKKSSETAIPGYLIRSLNTITSGVRLSKTRDCGTKQYLRVKIQGKEMLKSMQGKLYLDGSSLSEIGPKDTDLIGTNIKLRSPLYCKAEDGICATCYNPWFVDKMNLESNAGVGLLASTSLATHLTNLTLKGSHAGLSLSKKEVDLIHDITEFSE